MEASQSFEFRKSFDLTLLSSAILIIHFPLTISYNLQLSLPYCIFNAMLKFINDQLEVSKELHFQMHKSHK